MKRVRGQLLVELVLSVSLFSIFIGLFLASLRLCTLKREALMIASVGTDLVSTHRVPLNVVEEELKKLGREEWQFEIKRFTSTSASRFYQLWGTRVEPLSPHPFRLSEQVVKQQEPIFLP